MEMSIRSKCCREDEESSCCKAKKAHAPAQTTNNQPTKKTHIKKTHQKMQEAFISLCFGFYFPETELKLLYTLCADCGSHHCFLGREGDVLFASMNNGY